jgi:hypothetical protein
MTGEEENSREIMGRTFGYCCFLTFSDLIETKDIGIDKYLNIVDSNLKIPLKLWLE